MIHLLQRAKVHVLAGFVVPGVALAAAANEPSIKTASPEQVLLVLGGFVVTVAGALALAIIRWLGKVERNVPRDPARTAEVVGDVRKDLRALREEIHQIDRRVARIEGNLGQLVVWGDR